MADTTDVVTTPGSDTDPGVRRFTSALRTGPKPLRLLVHYAGIIPFVAYIAIFLIVPLVAIVLGAFQDPRTNAFTSLETLSSTLCRRARRWRRACTRSPTRCATTWESC